MLQSSSIYSCGTRYRGTGGDRCAISFFSFFSKLLTLAAQRLAFHRQPMCYVLYRRHNEIESGKFADNQNEKAKYGKNFSRHFFHIFHEVLSIIITEAIIIK